MLEVSVERITNGPEALAHLADGRVVLIEGALPGERVEVELVEQRRDYARARLGRILSPPGPSPARRPAPCPVAGECGGCSWQHVAYPEQLAFKREVVLCELRRQARLEPLFMPPPLSGGQWRTRSRIRLAIDRGRGEDPPAVGFRARRSRSVVPTRECGTADRRLGPLFGLARRAAALCPQVAEVELLVDDAGGLRLRLLVAGAPARGAVDLLAALRREPGGEALAGLSLEPLRRGAARGRPGREWGPPQRAGDVEQRLELAPGLWVRVPLGVFTQVRLDLHRALVAEVVRLLAGAEAVLDLYAGFGNFAIPLARRGTRVVAVERDREAVRAGRRAARSLDLAPRFSISARLVEEALAAGALREPWDGVLLDPPRAGAPHAVAAIAAAAPARVVYVSCDLATFARDAARLHERGYVLEELRLVDLTPQTHRVETVASFRLT